MHKIIERITPMPVPPESGIAKLYKLTDLADAFAITLPAGTSRNPEVLGRFLLTHLCDCTLSPLGGEGQPVTCGAPRLAFGQCTAARVATHSPG